ncbi:MAG: DMT family transporter [Verrucomicrobia bacterium]|nr:DMT family transporter [Verrucomicrobiota bacterium]
MSASGSHGAIVAGLVVAVFLWGGHNAGVKFLVGFWPPVWTGATRFLCAGLLLLAVLRWTRWLGHAPPLSREQKRRLWIRGGLVLALYIVAFNLAAQLIPVSHVALYLGASPVWALLAEGWRGRTARELVKRYAAAGLALGGLVVLFWPALGTGAGHLPGEALGLVCSVLWTAYGRQCRALGMEMSGSAVTAHTMWRAGVLLLPLGLAEIVPRGLPVDGVLLLVQTYCVVAGGAVAYMLWNTALRHWNTSEVYLFNNLIPPCTMLWAHFCLGEPMTASFWLAMGLVVAGVLAGQTNWEPRLGRFWIPEE